AGEADAITRDGGDVYTVTAGLNTYYLQPIIAEDYCECWHLTTKFNNGRDWAVAVAKNDTGFGFNNLRGKKSWHTGLDKSAGWNIPIGTLVTVGQINWAGIEDKLVEEVVRFDFMASFAPGTTKGSKGSCPSSAGA
ncbi:unnamed protein product, partial [Coregonus sp. 'balchen']